MDVSLGSTVHVLYAEEEEVPSKETECEENREKVINWNSCYAYHQNKAMVWYKKEEHRCCCVEVWRAH